MPALQGRAVAMEKSRKISLMGIAFFLVFLLFPMRHAAWGLDLHDTGYNYANFLYGGAEHMGSMWLFSTYLANVVGHLITMLPFGHTLLGMNLYTGLFITALSSMGYWFCTKKLGMNQVITFVGELAAMCMCWCPTAKLYDYLTYVLFLGCFIWLYLGLTEDKKLYLVLAGICLGTNVFVRFSNLPEAGLILAVWVYAFLERFQTKKKGRALYYTLWCLVGYLGALALFGGWICFRYGLGEYLEGISRLFAMTDTATDYKATSMVMGMILPYWNSLYWIKRMLVFVLAAFLFTLCGDYAPLCLAKKPEDAQRYRIPMQRVGMTAALLMIGVMVFWLFYRGFTTFYYYSYDPITWPGTIFLFLAMGMGAVDIFRPGNQLKDKLLAGLLILVLVLTSLGSNNGILPSMNNLFVAAPFVLDRAVRFAKWAWEKAKTKPESLGDFRLNFTAIALALWAIIAVCLVQFAGFGIRFAFCEGTGVQTIGYKVENIPALKGMTMSRERAQWMEEIGAYVQEKNLRGREVILYGWVPSLSFYLEMPAAFNTWSDLASYNVTVMEAAMEQMQVQIQEQGRQKPVVITSVKYQNLGPDEQGMLLDISEKELETLGVDMKTASDPKWILIRDYMGAYGYRKTFSNDKFVLWESN